MRTARLSSPRVLLFGVGVVAALSATPARAQPAPAAGQPRPAQPGAPPKAGQPQAATPTPAAAPDAPPKPPALTVSDPLLAPVAPAPHVLTRWRDAVAHLDARSTDLHIAVQEVERAEGQSRQALGAALPQIDATGSVTFNLIREDVARPTISGGTVGSTTETVPPSPTALASLTVAQPVLAPRAWYAIGTARRGVQAAKLKVDDQRRRVLAAAASAIVDVVTAERVAEIRRAGLQRALERLELVKRRLKADSGTKLDLVRADQDVNLARTDVITGDEALAKSREALGVTLGYAEPWGVAPDISLDDVEKSARELCSPSTPDTRSDVRAALADLEVAERAVTDVRLGYSPTAQVSSTWSLSSEELANTKHYAWSIQGVLTVPIWDGGSRYGQARSARATVAESKERVEASRRSATLEMRQAARAVVVADNARVLAEAGRDLARENARLSQVAFELGEGTSFELVESSRAQREAELNVAVREFELVRARIAALLAAASCTY